MKKKVAFQKEIEFPTMIGEINAISLEEDLHFVDESNVEGNLLLSGKYKLTEASRLEEDFNYKIPTEIALTERIDLDTAKVEIIDFYYEIDNDDVLICNIELLVEGVEVIDDMDTASLEDEEVRDIKEEVLDNTNKEERECDGDIKEVKEIELPKIEKEEKNEIKESNKIEEDEKMLEKEENTSIKNVHEQEEVKIEEDESNNSLFISLKEEKETYGTFLVYIVRQNESINSIIEKYNTNIEEVEKYNNINDISIGTKLIIPILND